MGIPRIELAVKGQYPYGDLKDHADGKEPVPLMGSQKLNRWSRASTPMEIPRTILEALWGSHTYTGSQGQYLCGNTDDYTGSQGSVPLWEYR